MLQYRPCGELNEILEVLAWNYLHIINRCEYAIEVFSKKYPKDYPHYYPKNEYQQE